MQNIFNIIFRVPSLDEVHDQVSQPEFLMNLGAGTSWSTPYILSAPDLDLAIISLDQRDSRFAEQLLSLGYKPVESSCVANGPSQEGEHVFTVGFPGSTSVLGQVSQHPASAQWSSSHVSLPVFSFGHVSMLHEALPFFWTDMSIYPGNSGGPVVADDRLVGIVSSQATLPFDHDPEIRSRIPFGKITRAEFIRPLLNELIKKDQEHEA